MSALLELRDVTVRYGHVTAVEGVSFCVDEGQALALLGSNGAGKTTILRAIGRLLPFHGGEIVSGEILLAGQSLARKSPAQLVEAGVSQALEGRRIFADLTVRENLLLGAYTASARKQASQRYDQMMDLFGGLRTRESSRGGLLSGGEQQMLAIARALMSGPRLLLLDEPSLGLAPRIVEDIGLRLRDIRALGTAILLVDQAIALPGSVTDEACLIAAGTVQRRGPTKELLADASVLESYLGISTEMERPA